MVRHGTIFGSMWVDVKYCPAARLLPLRTQCTVVARLRANGNAAIVSTLIVAPSIAHFLPNLGELTPYICLVLLTIEAPESAEHLKHLPDCIDPSHRFPKRCACLRAVHDKGGSKHTLNWSVTSPFSAKLFDMRGPFGSQLLRAGR